MQESSRCCGRSASYLLASCGAFSAAKVPDFICAKMFAGDVSFCGDCCCGSGGGDDIPLLKLPMPMPGLKPVGSTKYWSVIVPSHQVQHSLVCTPPKPPPWKGLPPIGIPVGCAIIGCCCCIPGKPVA